MKPINLQLLRLLLIVLTAAPVGRATGQTGAAFPPELIAFSKTTEQQARRSVTNLNLKVSPEVDTFFRAAVHGDYLDVKTVMGRLTPQYFELTAKPGNEVPPWVPLWQPMTDVAMAYDIFAEGGPKYPLAIGQGIIRSIPPGSIYFGGTDVGRGLVTALCESHSQGRPFFTLAQNALSDGRYLDYVRSLYGSRISLPTTNDVQTIVDAYKTDAVRRYRHDQDFPNSPPQLKPGELVEMVDGQLQSAGQVATMFINERIVKVILDQNPDREFYVEESDPMELLNPYLSPHGYVFKMDHKPVATLTVRMLEEDHAFWANECGARLGDWLRSETSVSNICAVVSMAYIRKDWSNFTGDPEFVTNTFATKALSKWRGSIGGLYQWRLMNRNPLDDRSGLEREADYAFRQAFALCPGNSEAVFRYANFLLSKNRFDDALLVGGTAAKVAPDDQQFQDLLSQLKNLRPHLHDAAH